MRNNEIEKSCEECGYCTVYTKDAFCSCCEKGCHVIKDIAEAEYCSFYDDDSWMN